MRPFVGSQALEPDSSMCAPPLAEDGHACDPATPYRTFSGHCNNLRKPSLGKSLTTFNRLLPPAYENGVSRPRLTSVTGSPLPSPRLVSTMIHADISNLHTRYSLMVMQYAQFLDHDLTFTPVHRGGLSSIGSESVLQSESARQGRQPTALKTRLTSVVAYLRALPSTWELDFTVTVAPQASSRPSRTAGHATRRVPCTPSACPSPCRLATTSTPPSTRPPASGCASPSCAPCLASSTSVSHASLSNQPKQLEFKKNKKTYKEEGKKLVEPNSRISQ